MGLGMRLEVKQSQQLVMTPQLQQAIKLLQMSNFELSAFVEREIERNPLLETDTREQAIPEAGPAPEVEADGYQRIDRQITADGDPGAVAGAFDTGHDNLHDSGPGDGPPPLPGEGSGWASVGAGGGGGGAAGDDLSLADRIADRISLADHLRSQIASFECPPLIGVIARALVDELDEHGYLRAETADLANRYGCAAADVEAAIALVQNCEPTGVGARSLAECLALQLAEQNRLDPAMQTLLDHLDLLGVGEHRRLRTQCGVDEEDYTDMLAELRTLDPRPCQAFDVTEPETLIPDVFVRRTDWGGWRVELNSDTLPRVLVDRAYGAELSASGDETVKSFVADCQANASWLMRSVDQRARTILKVTTEIVRRQEQFLDRGIGFLEPMTLREVADAVGLHESTVSRVTSNKYVATDRGIFELKFFFSTAVGTGGTEGGGVSAEVIRHRIKTLVDAEPPTDILSDDALVARLQSEGIDVARRTIAKYRKLLGIPSSVDRRRQKGMAVRVG